MDHTKDITLGAVTYQIGRMSARDSSWVAGQFMSRGLLNAAFNQITDNPKEPIDKLLGLALTYAFPDLPEVVFQGVQNRCYAVCKQYRPAGTGGTVPEPLLRLDGSARWNSKDEPDSLSATVLLIATLTFNLESFFATGARQMLAQIFPESILSLSNAPPSTDSSSDLSPQVSGGIAK